MHCRLNPATTEYPGSGGENQPRRSLRLGVWFWFVYITACLWMGGAMHGC